MVDVKLYFVLKYELDSLGIRFGPKINFYPVNYPLVIDGCEGHYHIQNNILISLIYGYI